jgi:hypothetical protein
MAAQTATAAHSATQNPEEPAMFGVHLPIPRVNVVKRGMLVPDLPRPHKRPTRKSSTRRRTAR